MRVLLDTDVFVQLEGSTTVDSDYTELLKVFQSINAEVLIHPASLDELRTDTDLSRQEVNLSKLNKYLLLQRPPECIDDLLKAGIDCSNRNDEIDCAVIGAVFKDAVHFLISEDTAIHTKAKQLGIGQRVFFVRQALASFATTYNQTQVQIPNIEQIFVHEIMDQLRTEFFDSLRENYHGFDDWFLDKCCRAGREAWVTRDHAGRITALCIFTPADPEPLTDEGKALPGKALKLCTFKVGPQIRGQKVGELFLKAAFRYSFQSHIEHIFLTVKIGQQPQLEALLSEFGFEVFGKNKDEFVMVKRHPLHPPRIQMDPLEYHKKFSPNMVATESIRKFIVPIRPNYHQLLFPDCPDTQLRLSFNSPLSQTGSPINPGNALKLAYLCHSKINKIRPGDILLFYRSEDFQKITSIGIVESSERLSDATSILERVLKRTVYGASEIDAMARKSTLVILFRLGTHFPNTIDRQFLERNGVTGNLQSIRQIGHKVFWEVAKQASIENCLLAD